MRAELPTACDVGLKRNAKGFTRSWIGYKLHLDVCEAGIPVAGILTSASTHDSQVAIPLARTSQQRVTWCYDIMDAAYDAQTIVEDSLAQGLIPVIDINPRADKDRKAEILAERARRAVVNIPDTTTNYTKSALSQSAPMPASRTNSAPGTSASGVTPRRSAI
jgi:hypothetical protein